MRATFAVVVLVLVSSPLLGAPQLHCADPRPGEPLLVDVRAFAASQDPLQIAHREAWGVTARSAKQLRRITDEEICSRASESYFAILKLEVPGLFSDTPNLPVVVIAVGDVYFVDDQRDRNEYWEVMVFDRSWKRLYGYGGGA